MSGTVDANRVVLVPSVLQLPGSAREVTFGMIKLTPSMVTFLHESEASESSVTKKHVKLGDL